MFIPILTALTTTQHLILLIVLTVNIGAICCIARFRAGRH